MRKKILVTGAGGNVGQYIADSLAHRGYEVIGIYRTSVPECADYQLVQQDLSEQQLELNDIDTIIHAAASLSGDTKKLIRDNIKSTENLVRYAEKMGIKKFIFLSTVSVFGNTEGELSEKSRIINPETYGMSKYLSECLVRESSVPEKIIIRLPRMLGPFVQLEDIAGSGFLMMAKQLLWDEEVICFIPEVQYNNYLHVNELAVFLERILVCSKSMGNKTILIGARERMKMRDILHIMKEEIGSESIISVKENKSLPKCSEIDISEAVKLGFAPGNAESMLKKFMREMHGKYRGMQKKHTLV